MRCALELKVQSDGNVKVVVPKLNVSLTNSDGNDIVSAASPLSFDVVDVPVSKVWGGSDRVYDVVMNALDYWIDARTVVHGDSKVLVNEGIGGVSRSQGDCAEDAPTSHRRSNVTHFDTMRVSAVDESRPRWNVSMDINVGGEADVDEKRSSPVALDDNIRDVAQRVGSEQSSDHVARDHDIKDETPCCQSITSDVDNMCADSVVSSGVCSVNCRHRGDDGVGCCVEPCDCARIVEVEDRDRRSRSNGDEKRDAGDIRNPIESVSCFGALCVVMSAILSRSVDTVLADMDEPMPL